MIALKNVLNQLEGKRIVIIGDVILDEYVWGDVNRISPEAPVPVLEVTAETVRFGGAANVAHNVVSLGGKAELLGVVGEDRNGQILTEMLQSVGISTAGVCVDPTRPTSAKTRVVARTSYTSLSTHQQIVRIDREVKKPVADDLRARLLAAAVSCIPDADAIIFEDYDKGVVSAELIQGVLFRARQEGKPVVVDPKVENFWNYKGVTSITPNHKEAGAALNRKINDEAGLVEVGEEILERLGLESLLITRGEQGMSLFRRVGDARRLRVDHIPTKAREVYDVTGAGDTVVATFTLAIAAKADLLDAARLSNLAGGIVVGEIGCVAVTREELLHAIHQEAQDENHIS
jgi:D-beta-D-heptose 7-phosphate kinase/D-beta-D-heptose 1-phosphate adenosyltransferase